jgi:hypothetical protein
VGTPRRLSIRARIVAAFVVVLALVAGVAGVGLHSIAEVSERLKEIVQDNNVKIELAAAMQTALRERSLSMHALSVLTDPFERDDETLRFDALGSDYVRARQQLESMPLSVEERAILARIRLLTRAAQPEVQAVVDMAAAGQADEAFERIRSTAVPRQRQIAEQVSALIQAQKAQAAAALEGARASYREARDLMLRWASSRSRSGSRSRSS